MESKKDLSWTEKYRPQTLDEIYDQSHVVECIKFYLNSENSKSMPHLLLSGPSGIGKTSLILAFSRQIFKNNFKSQVLFVNASCDRKIVKFQSTIKDFVTHSSQNNSPFKIVILDEVDSMTPQIQQLLQQYLEIYSNTSKFCLICNETKKINEELKTKCHEFSFIGLNNETIKKRLIEICISENFLIDKNAKITDEGMKILNNITKTAKYDMRKAITDLQISYKMHNNNQSSENIISNIYKLRGIINNETLTELHNFLKNIHENKINDRKEMINYISDMIKNNNLQMEYFLNDIAKLIIIIKPHNLGKIIKGLSVAELYNSSHISENLIISKIANVLYLNLLNLN